MHNQARMGVPPPPSPLPSRPSWIIRLPPSLSCPFPPFVDNPPPPQAPSHGPRNHPTRAIDLSRGILDNGTEREAR